MRRALCRLLAAWLLGVTLSVPHLAHAQDMDTDTGIFSGTTPWLCLDSMETEPEEGELVPIEISMDGGCMLSETPISI